LQLRRISRVMMFAAVVR